MLSELLNFARRPKLKSYLADTAILFAGLLAIGYFFLPGQPFNEIFPHPFWIPVVLMSAGYGSSGGVMTAVLALLIYLVSGVPEQATNQDYYAYMIAVWKQPALWILTAIILGETANRNISERHFLEEQMNLFKEQRQTIADYCDQLEDKYAGLEHQMATSGEISASELVEHLRSLGVLASRNLPAELPGLLEEMFGPLSFSLYECRNSGPALLLNHSGGGEDGEPQCEMCLSQTLWQRLESDRRTLGVLSARDRNILPGECLFAVPLIARGSGPVPGALFIHGLSHAQINETTRYILDLVGRELGPVLAQRGQEHFEQDLTHRESA